MLFFTAAILLYALRDAQCKTSELPQGLGLVENELLSITSAQKVELNGQLQFVVHGSLVFMQSNK